MVVVAAPDAAAAVETALRQAGETTFRIGHVTAGAGVAYTGQPS